MSHSSLRLRHDLHFSIQHADATPFGSAVSGLIDRLICRTCRPLFGDAEFSSTDVVSGEMLLALSRCFGDSALGQLYSRPGRLRDECLYPAADAVVPERLMVSARCSETSARFFIPSSLRPNLGKWVGDWMHLSAPPRSPDARSLWDQLERTGLLTTSPVVECVELSAMTLIGHATVAFERDGTRILFDPFLFSPGDSQSYRPLTAAELQVEAVFITHSHPDHYDLGALLQMGSDTRIYVPFVPRESLLALDMAARLEALGFSRVCVLRWNDIASVGPFRIESHALYGEQPTDGDVLHPECRNYGNIYVVNVGGRRVALLADAGRDGTGDCVNLARRLRRDGGPIDVLVGGYRAWRLQAAQYLHSSVARYLLFVPPDRWDDQMQIMNDADDLLRTAEAWGAHTVVPYANGGAPWHWDSGLGPRSDGVGDDSDSNFDPDLLPLATEMKRRGPESPRVVVLRPGEGMELCGCPSG